MGNLPLTQEELRDARIVNWLASSLRDLRHGVVLLHRDAGISALVVLVLALGIGGSAAIFTLLKACGSRKFRVGEDGYPKSDLPWNSITRAARLHVPSRRGRGSTLRRSIRFTL